VEPALFQGLPRLAANRSSYLQPRSSRLANLAGFAPVCFSGRTFQRLTPSQTAFAAGGVVGRGRVLVLADHSVFINQMLLQTDNDNFDFALRCADWLSAGEPARDRVLFVEDGVVIPRFEFTLQEMPLPLPPLPPLNELVNQTLWEIERSGALQRFLYERTTAARVLRFILLLATCGLVLWGLRGLMRGRYRPQPQLPRLDAELATLTGGGPLLEQRWRALAAAGNYWEAARTVARREWAELGIREAAPAEPRWAVAGNWWQRRQRQRQLARLWQLAFGPDPVPVRRSELDRLPDLAADLRAAYHQGLWHFEETDRQA
jgi:hypothetical protein